MSAVTIHLEELAVNLLEWMPVTELQILTSAAVLFLTVHDLQQTYTLIMYLYRLPTLSQ